MAFSGKEIVSMVFFGYHQSYLQYLEQQFVEFLALYGRETRKEFYLPSSANEVIEKQLMQCKVLPTDEKWCGVTYKEDKPQVQRIIQELIEKGVYPESLWQTD
ncbi:MAG: hypothetical protein H6765_05300 [Candidatus Peribacteria bacterium]|nr:MAG: hypothetical protein H6765_05300 [Candidatus Peribacteria bacterium]